MRKLSKFFVAVVLLNSPFNLAFAHDVSSVDCRQLTSTVDLDRITKGLSGEIIVGLSGGRGHSATWNEPHELQVCSIQDGTKKVEITDRCSTFQTEIDAEIMTSCQANAVVVGFSGGRGHSSTWNESHRFECCELKNYKTKVSIIMYSKVDNNSMISCPSGFAITGIEGGHGHSGDFNEPHGIQCSEISR